MTTGHWATETESTQQQQRRKKKAEQITAFFNVKYLHTKSDDAHMCFFLLNPVSPTFHHNPKEI